MSAGYDDSERIQEGGVDQRARFVWEIDEGVPPVTAHTGAICLGQLLHLYCCLILQMLTEMVVSLLDC